MLSRLLRIAEYIYKIAVTDAMAMLYTQEDISDGTVHAVSKTLIAVLNHAKDPPTCMVEEQKNFILSAIRAMSKFNIKDKEFVTELLVQFLDGDKEVRSVDINLLYYHISNNLVYPLQTNIFMIYYDIVIFHS